MSDLLGAFVLIQVRDDSDLEKDRSNSVKSNALKHKDSTIIFL